jgi:hypothetical protein
VIDRNRFSDSSQGEALLHNSGASSFTNPTTQHKADQRAGICEHCEDNTICSALVLADLDQRSPAYRLFAFIRLVEWSGSCRSL